MTIAAESSWKLNISNNDKSFYTFIPFTKDKSWRQSGKDKTFVVVWKTTKVFNESSPFHYTFAGVEVSCWECIMASSCLSPCPKISKTEFVISSPSTLKYRLATSPQKDVIQTSPGGCLLSTTVYTLFTQRKHSKYIFWSQRKGAKGGTQTSLTSMSAAFGELGVAVRVIRNGEENVWKHHLVHYCGRCIHWSKGRTIC
jgi:hypothetical protein